MTPAHMQEAPPHQDDDFRELDDEYTPTPVVDLEEPSLIDRLREQRIAETLASLKTPDRGIRWFLPALNKKIDTFCRGDLIIFTASTGGAKTTFAQNVADGWARDGQRSFYFSTEQPVDEMTKKMACISSGISFRDARRGKLNAHWQGKLEAAVAAQGQLPLSRIEYHRDPSPTARDVVKTIRAVVKCGVENIIIDHAGRIELKGARPEWQEMKAFVRYLKKLAVKLRIRILLLAQQMSEEGDGRRLRHLPPSMVKIQGGQSAAHEADVVLGGFQPCRRGASDKEINDALRSQDGLAGVVEANTVAIVVLKAREEMSADTMVPSMCWVIANKISPRDMNNARSMPAETEYARHVRTRDEEERRNGGQIAAECSPPAPAVEPQPEPWDDDGRSDCDDEDEYEPMPHTFLTPRNDAQ